MTTFYLMRHGEPHWRIVNDRKLVGAANDLAPLTPRGIQEAEAAAERLRASRPTLVLSSPMTRALQSAAIVSRQLALPLAVEFDLHEWVPDTTYRWDSPRVPMEADAEMRRLGG